MKKVVSGLVLLLAFSAASWSDDLALLRMSEERRAQLVHYLENNPCNCGCGMTIGQCLRDDPACPVSPELARAAIQAFSGNAQPSHHTDVSGSYSSEGDTYINSSQNGSVVSGNVNGQNCTYASVGGTTIKSCD